ncbi:neurexin-1b-like [Sycon ciliatum]|uniref:neurexin-1b-like n=1 Tax=Sycon ciliatum TaxID=27933 RepID=UPI0031F63FDB
MAGHVRRSIPTMVLLGVALVVVVLCPAVVVLAVSAATVPPAVYADLPACRAEHDHDVGQAVSQTGLNISVQFSSHAGSGQILGVNNPSGPRFTLFVDDYSLAFALYESGSVVLYTLRPPRATFNGRVHALLMTLVRKEDGRPEMQSLLLDNTTYEWREVAKNNASSASSAAAPVPSPNAFSSWDACIYGMAVNGKISDPTRTTKMRLFADGAWCCDKHAAGNQFIGSPSTGLENSCGCGRKTMSCMQDSLIASFPGDANIYLPALPVDVRCDTKEHPLTVLQIEFQLSSQTNSALLLKLQSQRDVFVQVMQFGNKVLAALLQKSKSTVIMSNALPLSDSWVRVAVYIRRTAIHLLVNAEAYTAVYQPMLLRDEWRSLRWSVLVGGGGNTIGLSPGGDNYYGCMRRVYVDGNHVLKLASIGAGETQSQTIRQGQVTFGSRCEPKLYRCNNEALLLLSKKSSLLISDTRLKQLESIAFSFRTAQHNSTVLGFLDAQSTDPPAGGVFISNSLLCVHIGAQSRCSQKSYSDKQVHAVKIWQTRTQLVMQVDEKEQVELEAPSLPSSPKLIGGLNASQVLVGGPESRCVNTAVGTGHFPALGHFVGCIGQLRINGLCFSAEADFPCSSQRYLAANATNSSWPVTDGSISSCDHDFCAGQEYCRNSGACQSSWTGPTCNCQQTGYYGPMCQHESTMVTLRCDHFLHLDTSRLNTTAGLSVMFRFDNTDPDTAVALLAAYDPAGRPILVIEKSAGGFFMAIPQRQTYSWASSRNTFLPASRSRGFVHLMVSSDSVTLDVQGKQAQILLFLPLEITAVVIGKYRPIEELTLVTGRIPKPLCGYINEVLVNGDHVLDGYPTPTNDIVRGTALLGLHSMVTHPVFLQNSHVRSTISPPTTQVAVSVEFRITKSTDLHIVRMQDSQKNIVFITLTESNMLTLDNRQTGTSQPFAMSWSTIPDFHDGQLHVLLVYLMNGYMKVVLDGFKSSPLNVTGSGSITDVRFGARNFVGCLSSAVVNGMEVDLRNQGNASVKHLNYCPSCVPERSCNLGYCINVASSNSFECRCASNGDTDRYCRSSEPSTLPKSPTLQSGTLNGIELAQSGSGSTGFSLLFLIILVVFAALIIIALVVYFQRRYVHRHNGHYYPQQTPIDSADGRANQFEECL